MRTRLSVLAGLTLFALAGVAAPGTASAADAGCTPAFAESTLQFGPSAVTITAKGSATFTFAADFTAACGDADGGDLEAYVLYASPKVDTPFAVDATEAITTSADAHNYHFETSDKVKAKELKNSEAGTWVSVFAAYDDDDQKASDDPGVADGPTVQVLRAAQVTAKATPDPVKKGKKLTVAGKLTRADWQKGKDVAYAKQSVALQFKPKGGAYAAVKSVKAGSTGKLSTTVTATVDGSYRYAFAGNATTSAATSAADPVDVR